MSKSKKTIQGTGSCVHNDELANIKVGDMLTSDKGKVKVTKVIEHKTPESYVKRNITKAVNALEKRIAVVTAHKTYTGMPSAEAVRAMAELYAEMKDTRLTVVSKPRSKATVEQAVQAAKTYQAKLLHFVDNKEQEHVFLYVYMTARLLASTAELNKRLDACFAHCFNW